MSKVKVCFAQSCHTVLKPPKRKFCSDKCSRSYHNKKFYAEQQGAVYEPENEGKPVATPDTQKRRGEVYEKLYEFDLGPKILKKEINRQDTTVELIASENFASQAVMDLCGSVFTNKYAEGYSGKRYYNGCKYMDEIEDLATEAVTSLYESFILKYLFIF